MLAGDPRPYNPFDAVTGKVADSDVAGKMALVARARYSSVIHVEMFSRRAVFQGSS
jgi:hypothetical protein